MGLEMNHRGSSSGIHDHLNCLVGQGNAIVESTYNNVHIIVTEQLILFKIITEQLICLMYFL